MLGLIAGLLYSYDVRLSHFLQGILKVIIFCICPQLRTLLPNCGCRDALYQFEGAMDLWLRQAVLLPYRERGCCDQVG